MKKIFASSILLLQFFSMHAQPVQTIFIIDKKVQLSLPAGFLESSKENGGAATWMDKSSGAELSYQFQGDSITDNDIPAFADDQLKLAKQDDESFDYIDDGIYLQDGKNIGYLKFSTKANGKKYFNYTFFISVNNRPLVFRFSAVLKDRKKWESRVDETANSLRVLN